MSEENNKDDKKEVNNFKINIPPMDKDFLNAWIPSTNYNSILKEDIKKRHGKSLNILQKNIILELNNKILENIEDPKKTFMYTSSLVNYLQTIKQSKLSNIFGGF